MKRLYLLLVALALAAGQPAAAATPDWLVPYLQEDGIDPTQLGWLRFAFAAVGGTDGARPDLGAWLRARQAERARNVSAEMASLGLPGGARPACFGDPQCTWVEYGLSTAQAFPNWEALEGALADVRPYFLAYRLGVQNSEAAAAPPEDASLRERILALRIGDQALRAVFAMGLESTELPLDRSEMRLFRMLVAMEMLAQNVRHLAVLRQLVSLEEWPKRSEVGETAATTVFLIVQHAVQDPAFQIGALRAMKTAVDAGEANPRQYALLYDRVMLFTTGRQRYGSQFVCRQGRYVPDDLEDAQNVDRIRSEVGLGSLADYAGTLPTSC